MFLWRTKRCKIIVLQISHSALSELERSEAWLTSGFKGRIGYSAEDIYGPNGKFNWLWPLRLTRRENMRSDLCTNMGGGVPIAIIEALIAICVEEGGKPSV